MNLAGLKMLFKLWGYKVLFPTFFDNFGDVGIRLFSGNSDYFVIVVFLAPIIPYRIAILATVQRSSLQNLYNLAVGSRLIMKIV